MTLTFRTLHPHFVVRHRARPFDDTRYRRELRRVTTLDIESPALVVGGS
jgi:hypothetical protein